MKKLIVVLMCILFLTGCTCECENAENENDTIESVTFDLVADRTTNIIYIKSYTYGIHVAYTPYYSENGKLCKLVDNKIVEVDEK